MKASGLFYILSIMAAAYCVLTIITILFCDHLKTGNPNPSSKTKIVWVKFGRWSGSHMRTFTSYRIYLAFPKRWYWTPFVEMEFRYKPFWKC